MGKTAGQKVRDRYRVYVANGKTPRALTGVNRAMLEEVRMEVAAGCRSLKAAAFSTTKQMQQAGDEEVRCVQHTGLRVDWATWLVLDMQDEGSDDDLDYKDTEEQEEAEELSDNDVSDLEVDQLQTVCELCVEIAQAQVFVAYQEQDRKKLQDKIGSLEEQLDLLSKAAGLETSGREALETSAKEAIEQAASAKKSLEAATVALAEARRQLAWHQDQGDWIHSFYVHGGPPPPDVMRRM